jgi:hypothetical protein
MLLGERSDIFNGLVELLLPPAAGSVLEGQREPRQKVVSRLAKRIAFTEHFGKIPMVGIPSMDRKARIIAD